MGFLLMAGSVTRWRRRVGDSDYVYVQGLLWFMSVLLGVESGLDGDWRRRWIEAWKFERSNDRPATREQPSQLKSTAALV